jgi:hypothetical protein
VEAAVEDDDRGPAGGRAGDLDRVLDRFRAAVQQDRLLGWVVVGPGRAYAAPAARRELGEPPADLDVRLVAPDHEALIQVAVDLLVDRGDDGRLAVPEVHAADPAREVEVLLAPDVPDASAGGAVDDELRRRDSARDVAGPVGENALGGAALLQRHRRDSTAAQRVPYRKPENRCALRRNQAVPPRNPLQ